MSDTLYFYKAYVEKVYDGDTITCTIDCGFNMSMKNQKIRLYGINCPELRGTEKEAGKVARDQLRNQILHKNILIETFKDKKGKDGRYLATVFLDNVNINEWLVQNGYAVVAKY